MMLAFGIGFEFPILLVFLQLAGVVDRRRSCASSAATPSSVIVVIVAVATPSADPISMLALLIPMCLFYEAAIVFGRIRERAPAQGGGQRSCLTRRPDRFTLDRFQVEAIEAIDAGQSVLVAAPTGSGKTVVAEHAVAPGRWPPGSKAFYTTPIKALSNQKFTDLVAEHGADRVGLLTGDNAVNGDAPIVVMTTEVLRNMIYAGSPALRRPRRRRARRGPLPPGPATGARCGRR